MWKFFPIFLAGMLFANFFLTSFVFADDSQNSPKSFTTKMLNNLKFGKTNDDIKFLQKTLNDFGYFESDVDNPTFSGTFDKSLKDAINDFQKSNQIKVTGVVDASTEKTLNEFLKWEDDQNQQQANANPYVDNTNSLDNYTNGIDNYSGSSGFNYFNSKSGDVWDMYSPSSKATTTKKSFISKVGDVVDTIFGLNNSSENQNKKQKTFDIFDCFLDYKCSHAK